MFLLQENCPDKLNASSFIYFWESYLRDEKKKTLRMKMCIQGLWEFFSLSTISTFIR